MSAARTALRFLWWLPTIALGLAWLALLAARRARFVARRKRAERLIEAAHAALDLGDLDAADRALDRSGPIMAKLRRGRL